MKGVMKSKDTEGDEEGGEAEMGLGSMRWLALSRRLRLPDDRSHSSLLGRIERGHGMAWHGVWIVLVLCCTVPCLDLMGLLDNSVGSEDTLFITTLH